MRKLVSAVFLIGIILCLIIPPRTILAQELSVKKVISVVFDDSGSMNDASKKWVYANYAMQTFTGLLNQKDELSITYMSEYGIAKGFDVSKNVQKSVDNVRDHFRSGGTPKEAIDTAIAKLKSTNDPNPNTQYWLVVITDGKIYPAANEDAKLTNRDLTDLFTSFTSEKMPNGTNPQVSYFAIGSQAIQIQEDINNNLNSYFASTSSEIFEVMSRIADKVSGRTRIDVDKLTFLDENTVQFTSELPMLNIAVLAQKTAATVESAVGRDTVLKLDQSAKLLYPKEQTGLPTDESLKGTTFLFTNGPDNAPPGTYTISFSEPVTADSVVIMYEPAIEIRMQTYRSGTDQKVTNLEDLYAGDEIDVFGKIFESGTDTEIDASLLKDNVTYYIAYTEEGITKRETSDRSLNFYS